MSADDHLQPQQLQMFMPAGQIAKLGLLDSAGPTPEHHKATLARKLQEVKDSPQGRHNGPYSFAGSGIHDPLSIRHGGRYDNHLIDGHHRLAWAADRDPSMELPVEHTDAMNSRTMKDYHDMAWSKIRRANGLPG